MQKRQNTLVRQGQIADAAAQLVAKFGSEHLTVRRIAEQIGISEGAIYRHFKSKRDILLFLIDHIQNDLISDVTSSEQKSATALATLDCIVHSHLSSIEHNKGVRFQVIAEIISYGDRTLNQKVSSALESYRGRIRDIVAQGIAAGEIRPDIDPDTASMLFFSFIQGLVNIWTLSDYSFNLAERYLAVWSILRYSLTLS